MRSLKYTGGPEAIMKNEELSLLHGRKSAFSPLEPTEPKMYVLIFLVVFAASSSAAKEPTTESTTSEPCWVEVESFDPIYHEVIYKWQQVDCNSKAKILD
jgi:hypothetical protein